MQTLLKVTKANVWASIAPGRSFFASTRGIAMALRPSWGMNARDSKWKLVALGLGRGEEDR